MVAEYARELGARLRAIRQQQGLSLHGVEQKSDGRWKAVVVGSYERGDRAVTVPKLAELAQFYSVPLAELLPGGGRGGIPASEPMPKVTLDLERLGEVEDPAAAPLVVTPRPSSRFAVTTTARSSRSARKTCAPWPSSTTSR